MPTLSTEVREEAKAAEDSFREWAEARGWEVHRNGWPDFLCVDRQGRVVLVEAKSGNASLKKAQREVMAILAAAGLRCYTWSLQTGLVPFSERRRGVTTWSHREPPLTLEKPPHGLPRRLWEISGVGREPI